MFFFQAEDGIRYDLVTGVQTCALPISAFRRILNHPRLGPGLQGLAGRAFILETPIDKPGDDRRNVRTLWELVGVDAKQAPGAVAGFSMVRGKKRKISTRSAHRERRKLKKTTKG